MQEAHLVAAIEAGAIGLDRMEGHPPDHARHGVRQLDFIAGAPFLAVQFRKNLGCRI